MLAAIAAQDFSKVEAAVRRQDEGGAAARAARPRRGTALQTQLGALQAAAAATSRVGTIADKRMVITAVRVRAGDGRRAVRVRHADSRISGLAFRPAAAAPVALHAAVVRERRRRIPRRDATVGSDEWTLPGTLTLPAGAGPFPAVVLVHGSGPNDRDETVGAEQAVQGPRASDSPRAASPCCATTSARRSTARSRGAAAIHREAGSRGRRAGGGASCCARSRRSIAARVFVLGHSLGGMLVPRIAAADPALAGFDRHGRSRRGRSKRRFSSRRSISRRPTAPSHREEQTSIDEAATLARRCRR